MIEKSILYKAYSYLNYQKMKPQEDFTKTLDQLVPIILLRRQMELFFLVKTLMRSEH